MSVYQNQRIGDIIAWKRGYLTKNLRLCGKTGTYLSLSHHFNIITVHILRIERIIVPIMFVGIVSMVPSHTIVIRFEETVVRQ
ncbi:MAG: hypothetical protein AMJ88_18985 [Anaerolineae bacterium SM23_ 63]|nr:MAG: hypothetical protein AMJ88_18985 [Anaerolineae bacterium SM23_ 63]